MNDEKIDFKEWNSEVPNLHNLPDGAFRIKEASSKKLSYNVQVNDVRYYQYHWNNGITKFTIQDPNSNISAVFMSPIEGQIAAVDMINKAYIHKMFNDTYIMTGV